MNLRADNCNGVSKDIKGKNLSLSCCRSMPQSSKAVGDDVELMLNLFEIAYLAACQHYAMHIHIYTLLKLFNRGPMMQYLLLLQPWSTLV